MLDYKIFPHAKPGFWRYMPHFNLFITEPVTTGYDRFFCGFLWSWSTVLDFWSFLGLVQFAVRAQKGSGLGLVSRTVFSRTFSIVLRPSRDIPTCSRPLSVCLLAIPIRPVPFRCLLICSVTRPFRVFRLFPSISLFLLVSFQFSILGSDRSESGSLFSIRLHSCSATIPFSVDLRVLLFSDLMTSVFPFKLWSFSYCSVLYIIPASYVVSR